MNELTHHGADDNHRRFAAGGEAGFEGLAPSCPRDRDHRGHVKSLSEEGMAHFGQAWLSADAAAGFMLPRIKASVGCCLPGILETRRAAEEREQDRDGFHAKTGYAVQQAVLPFQRGVAVNVPPDFRVDAASMSLIALSKKAR